MTHRRAGTAGELHAVDLPLDDEVAWRLEVTGPAFVLGSTQPDGIIDVEVARSHGIEVARRRSGGGVVALGPLDSVWVDITLPVGDRRWDDDVHRAFWWVGELWAEAISTHGQPSGPITVHRDVGVDADLGRVACFAGIGSGEVLVGGRKAVGISQRRTRAGARFQCVAYRRWDPAPLLAALRVVDDPTRAAVADRLVGRVVAVPGLDRVVDAVVAAVPSHPR